MFRVMKFLRNMSCSLFSHNWIYPGYYPEICKCCGESMVFIPPASVSEECSSCHKRWIGWHECPKISN